MKLWLSFVLIPLAVAIRADSTHKAADGVNNGMTRSDVKTAAEDIDVLALVGAKKCCACKEDPNRKGKCKKDTNGKTSGCGPDCDHEPGYKCWHRLGYIFHDLDCEKYN
ncbi:unnamed protein product [Symbiodinium natans]|uniref:Uncharacterized protein n=1 Tax=Symbiodinium natans TaxID=878477 RepID=A0A812MK12_9DINO|nr:unnamed protein product [Symbiodinium natans]